MAQERGQNNKQLSRKLCTENKRSRNTNNTKNRGERRCSGRVGSNVSVDLQYFSLCQGSNSRVLL